MGFNSVFLTWTEAQQTRLSNFNPLLFQKDSVAGHLDVYMLKC